MVRFASRSTSARSLLLLLFPVSGWAAADPLIEGEIEKGLESLQIELESFVLPGGGGQSVEALGQLDDIVFRDLEYTDLFSVLRVARYEGKSHSASVALVRAAVEQAGAGFRLRGRVESLPGNELIFQREYPFSKSNARAVAHEFADDIVARLMGEAGICRTQIVFSRRNGAAKDLWLIDFDGENLRQLTSDGTINIFPSWAPDGDQMVFTTFKRGHAELALLTLSSRTSRILSLGAGMNMGAEWSPNGRWIAFSRSQGGDTDLYLMASDGTGIRPVAQSRGIDTAVDWSPDGSRIAFVSDRSGNPQVYSAAVSGGGLQRLTFAGDYNDAPAWSPDGSWIAFVSRDRHTMNLYVMTPSGEGMRPIVYGKGDCEGPSWAPDSRHLVYTRLQGGQRRLFIFDLKTSRERQLTTGPGDCYGPAWSPVPSARSGLASSR
jgi:TolB protein